MLTFFFPWGRAGKVLHCPVGNLVGNDLVGMGRVGNPGNGTRAENILTFTESGCSDNNL